MQPALRRRPGSGVLPGPRRLETLAGQQSAHDTYEIRRVRMLIAQGLSTGQRPTLAEAARELGVGPRTLQRRLLAARRLTFSGLVDEVRRESAERLLADARLTFEEVSYLLGSSDASALRKARRRWRGGVSRGDRSLTRPDLPPQGHAE